MTDLGAIGGLFAIFCRVGCCMMLLPGLSALRMPAPVRLFLALGISLALGPLLLGHSVPLHGIGSEIRSLSIFASECITGFAIGLIARCLFTALQLAGTLIAQISGYGHPLVSDDGHGEMTSEFGALLSGCVVALLFVLDLHLYAIEALVESYTVIRFAAGIDPPAELDRIVLAASDAFRLAIRISAPFILASLLINLAFGMLNRVAPQIPVFFISSAFLIAAMLWLTAALLPEIVRAIVLAVIGSFQRG